LVGRGKKPLLVESLPLVPLLLEAPLMDPGVPAVGEVTIGAVDEAAGEGACGDDVAGTSVGAWVAPGMVSDHPG